MDARSLQARCRLYTMGALTKKYSSYVTVSKGIYPAKIIGQIQEGKGILSDR